MALQHMMKWLPSFGVILGVSTSIVVLMLAWEPPLIGPLAGLDFDWSGWNISDLRRMIELDEWPCDATNRLVQAKVAFSLSGHAWGPESLAFDATGVGPYTGVADGRIIRWDAGTEEWKTFGVTAIHREDVCDIHPPSIRNEHICGRPLGVKFDKHGNLYVADAYFGLVVMGPNGGVAKPVSSEAEGVAFKFVNDLDMDENGTVYFTDSSARRPRRQCNFVTFEQDRSGRLLKYEPGTQQTTVLARGLYYPNGIAISQDNTFLLLCLTSKIRIMKYWLKGPKAGSMEEFAEVPGYPDNIRRTQGGDFWVALHSRQTKLQYFLGKNWYLLRLLYKLPLPLEYIMSLTTEPPNAMVIKLSPTGKAIDAYEDREGVNAQYLSYVEERNGMLWMSSVFLPYIWTLELNASVH